MSRKNCEGCNEKRVITIPDIETEVKYEASPMNAKTIIILTLTALAAAVIIGAGIWTYQTVSVLAWQLERNPLTGPVITTVLSLATVGLGAWLFILVKDALHTRRVERARNELTTVQFYSDQFQTWAVNPLGLSMNNLSHEWRLLIDNTPEVDPGQWQIIRTIEMLRNKQPHRVSIKNDMMKNLLTAGPMVPDLVNLENVVNRENASIRRLYLGAGDGGRAVVGDLKNLSHMGIAGTSRWGKSTFVQALLYQLIIAPEPVDFYLSDVGGQAFEGFGIPYADTVGSSEKIVSHVHNIFQERWQLFKAAARDYGQGIRTLDIYNQLTGSQLPYIMLGIDEVTALLDDSKTMEAQLGSLILQAGKYGVFLLLSGQNWKADNVGKKMRDQLSSRFQLKAMDRHQASILIPNSGAEDFTIKGRASVWLPGASQPEIIQTPLIDESTISTARQHYIAPVATLAPSIFSLPVAPDDEPEADNGGYDDSDRRRICELYEAGDSLTAICTQLHGYKNQRRIEAIKDVLKDAGLLG